MRTSLFTLAALALTYAVCAQPINLDEYRVDVQNVESVNTKYSEYGMVRSADGRMTFTSDREKFDKRNDYLGEASFNMYTCDLQRSYKTVRPHPATYRSSVNNGSATPLFGQTFYFTGTNKKATLNWMDATSYHTMVINQATQVNGKWKVKPVKPFKSKHCNYGQPTLTADGKTMYLISDREGGYGGTDLYVSHLGPDGWSEPINLGPEVNTSENEMFPFIHDSGILFFASEGHRGFGGLDLYMTAHTSEGWTTPENLGSPVNTPADDFSVFIDADFREGWFSSDRSGGMGGDDIYQVAFTRTTGPLSVSNSETEVSQVPAIQIADQTPALADPVLASELSDANTAPSGMGASQK